VSTPRKIEKEIETQIKECHTHSSRYWISVQEHIGEKVYGDIRVHVFDVYSVRSFPYGFRIVGGLPVCVVFTGDRQGKKHNDQDGDGENKVRTGRAVFPL
jgi:hypothetical protein